MSKSSSKDHFERSLNSKFAIVKTAISDLISNFGQGQDLDRCKIKAVSLQQSLEELSSLLANDDIPVWHRRLSQVTSSFVANPTPHTREQLLLRVVNEMPEIKPIELLEVKNAFNFDAMFEQCMKELEISELFEKMIDELTIIIENDEVDSRIATEAIERMIEALEANRDGSWSSVLASFNYSLYTWNLTVEYLKMVPGVKQAVNAFEKTIKQTDDRIKQLPTKLQVASKHLVEIENPRLTLINTAVQAGFIEKKFDNGGSDEDVIEGEFEPHDKV